jgi:hypothetical protein
MYLNRIPDIKKAKSLFEALVLDVCRLDELKIRKSTLPSTGTRSTASGVKDDWRLSLTGTNFIADLKSSKLTWRGTTASLPRAGICSYSPGGE